MALYLTIKQYDFINLWSITNQPAARTHFTYFCTMSSSDDLDHNIFLNIPTTARLNYFFFFKYFILLLITYIYLFKCIFNFKYNSIFERANFDKIKID